MALNTAARDRILERRERVAKLRVMGKSQRAIAAIIGVDVATINHDLRAIEDQWRANATATIAEHRANQLATAEAVKQAAWKNGDDPDLKIVLDANAQGMKLIGTEAAQTLNVITQDGLQAELAKYVDAFRAALEGEPNAEAIMAKFVERIG